MLKLLVCFCTIASLFLSASAPEIRNTQDINNHSLEWNSCREWLVLKNGAEHNHAECRVEKSGLAGGIHRRRRVKVISNTFTAQTCVTPVENARNYRSVRSNQHPQKNSIILAIANLSDIEEYQEDARPIESRWSRRPLCAILKKENVPEDYIPDSEDAREFQAYSQQDNYKGKRAKRRTLLDQEGLFSWKDMLQSTEDKASFTHIRVKRQKKDEEETSLQCGQRKYLQQLADSFPRETVRETTALSTESSLLESADDLFTESESRSKNDRIVRSVRHKSNRENIKHSHPLDGMSEHNPSNVVPQKNKRGHVKKVYNRKHRKKKKGVSRTKTRRNNRARHTHRVNLHGNRNKHAEEKLENRIASLREELMESNQSKIKGLRISNTTAADNLSESIELRIKRNGENDEQDSLRNKRANSVEYYKSNEEPVATNELFPGQKMYQDSNVNAQYNRQALQSAQEVEHLAKELVEKVGVLESYLHYDAINSNERKAEIPAIDDLCSNVTLSYIPKKEPLKVTSECERSSTPSAIETKVAVKRNANGKKKTEKKLTRQKSAKKGNGSKKYFPHIKKRREAKKPERKWGRWTDWSSCSVSCGKGRQIRWRYCLHDCETAEIEMDEKACQLPACPPGKFLGIF